MVVQDSDTGTLEVELADAVVAEPYTVFLAVSTVGSPGVSIGEFSRRHCVQVGEIRSVVETVGTGPMVSKSTIMSRRA
jgi:hypothetical protein